MKDIFKFVHTATVTTNDEGRPELRIVDHERKEHRFPLRISTILVITPQLVEELCKALESA